MNPNAQPEPRLGSGSVPNRYAEDEVKISEEQRQRINDFVTKKLKELGKKK